MSNSKIKNWLWPHDFHLLPVWQRGFRLILRFLFIFLTEFKRDRINLRATALTYSVVLSLVPMLALSTAVLKGMGAGDQMHQAAYQLIDNLSGDSRYNNLQPSKPSRKAVKQGTENQPNLPPEDSRTTAETTPNKNPAPALKKNFSGYLYEAVDKIFAYVERTNFAALGIIGTFLLLVTVLIVINGIEEALNAIWQVEKSRSPRRKFMNYMALIIICPLTINLGIGATTMLNAPAIAKHLDTIFPIIWIQVLLFKLLPIALLTLTFVLVYYFLPNLKIKAKAAWLGGLTGALLLLSIQKIFILLQVGVANYNAIYGSFATVPLFLLWIHSAWLVFLIGAEVAFTIEHFENYHSRGFRLPPGPEMALTFDLVNEIYKHFDQRREATLNNLAAATKESTVVINKLLKRLIKADMVHLTDDRPPIYLPTTPAVHFKAEEISSLLWAAETAKPETPGRKLAATFFKAGNQALPQSSWGEKQS
jgi:membrane protein